MTKETTARSKDASTDPHAAYKATLPKSLGTGGKTAAVAAAVASQLNQEGHWPPNDITKIMGADYGYAQASMTNFLNSVQWRLRSGMPPYQFSFDGPFVNTAISDSVGHLIGDIDAGTV